jgi:hypothetical protein
MSENSSSTKIKMLHLKEMKFPKNNFTYFDEIIEIYYLLAQ